MIIKCTHCFKNFEANETQIEFINECMKKEMSMCMLTCNLCRYSVSINPLDLLGEKDRVSEDPIRCPKCLDGYVSYVDDGVVKFWGCGECSNIWDNLKDLENDAILK